MEAAVSGIIQDLIALPVPKRKAALARFKERGIDINRFPVPKLRAASECPLSHSQERLWFLWHLEPSSPAYNIAAVVRIRGVLDAAKLNISFENLLRRHDSLRTTFESGLE